MKYAFQKQLRSDTSSWPNYETAGLHLWSHLHKPLRLAKRSSAAQLRESGGTYSPQDAARIVAESIKDLPPGFEAADLKRVDFRWLAIIWNHSAGLADQLDELKGSESRSAAA